MADAAAPQERLPVAAAVQLRVDELNTFLDEWAGAEPPHYQDVARGFVKHIMDEAQAFAGNADAEADWTFESAYPGNPPSVPPHLKITIIAVGPPPPEEDDEPPPRPLTLPPPETPSKPLSLWESMPTHLLQAMSWSATPLDTSALATTSPTFHAALTEGAMVRSSVDEQSRLRQECVSAIESAMKVVAAGVNTASLESCVDLFVGTLARSRLQDGQYTSIIHQMAHALLKAVGDGGHCTIELSRTVLSTLQRLLQSRLLPGVQGVDSSGQAELQQKIDSFTVLHAAREASDARRQLEASYAANRRVADQRQAAYATAACLSKLAPLRDELSDLLSKFRDGDVGIRRFKEGQWQTPLEARLKELIRQISALPASAEQLDAFSDIVRSLGMIPWNNASDARGLRERVATKALLPVLKAVVAPTPAFQMLRDDLVVKINQQLETK
jgi:hypothetical protein